MIEPFIWMFKANNFKQRYLQLLTSVFLVLLSIVVLYVLSLIFSGISSGIFLLIIILPAFLVFFIQGYFWELTTNVVNREVEICASNVYSGKIKNIIKIELPEFKPLTYIWRGFASIVASILMFLPFLLLVFSSMYTNVFFLPYPNIELYHHIYAFAYNAIYVIFFALAPALLWNYARDNSVVAVWNFRRAIYLVESYPIRYLVNTLIFVLFYILNYYILFVVAKITNLSSLLSSLSFDNALSYLVPNIFVFIFIFLSYVIYLYSLHVYAYLLGTIAPNSEG